MIAVVRSAAARSAATAAERAVSSRTVSTAPSRSPSGPDDRAGAPHGEHLGAVGAADAPARLAHDLAAEHGAGERQLGGRVRGAVVGEQVVGGRVRLGCHVELRDAVQTRGGRVHEGDPARGVGHDYALGELRQGGEQRSGCIGD
jgi:hypothetical protein